MMPLWSKLAPYKGSQAGRLEQRKKISKLETGRLRALIFGMEHLLVDLYQVCKYDAPGIKTGIAQWGHKLEHRDKEDQLQISSSVKLEGLKL